ncbi:proteasome subunit beta type-4 [Solea senegalensis]|uniref:Proteasome subunit beta type-4 n=1 Tax=Solea senegalensis TaxID=28829 RepID=A0AAV6R847_SOLSE|nr:proteasome subunit beta type-4 [Solea senegalensis]
MASSSTKTESSWLNITSSTSDTNMLEMFEENNINGKCFSAQNNLTIDGNTVTAHYANITTLFHVLPSSDSVVAFSANSTITGDIDVLLNFFNITTTTKQEEGAIHSLYLMGRETTAANDSDLEHFKKQAKCLGFDHEPVFIYDSNKGFCAKDKLKMEFGVKMSLWEDGPRPGQLYSLFPGGSSSSGPVPACAPIRHTLTPMVTGTSVLGVKFSGGVIIAADMLGSYGSLARFRNISRLMKVNNSTILGASGDYADYQHLKHVIQQMVIDEELLGDGHSYSPKALHSWLTRVMYNRRSRMNPLWNTVVIGGFYNGEGFLGYVDKLGVAYEAPTVATGFGAYLAQPLMREVVENKVEISQQEALDLVERCLKVLYYRDARSYNRHEIAIVTEKGVEIIGPLSSETNWDIARMVSGFE